jgi:hypothetical protein
MGVRAQVEAAKVPMIVRHVLVPASPTFPNNCGIWGC